MQEIKELIVGLGLIHLVYHVFYIWVDAGYLPNKKPFNCVTCIGFWITLILLIVFNSIILLSLPLLYHILIKLISKL